MTTPQALPSPLAWYDPRRALALPRAYRTLMRALGADAALSTFIHHTPFASPPASASSTSAAAPAVWRGN